MISSRLPLFTKLSTNHRRFFINSASGIINCGCQNIKNKYILGNNQNRNEFGTLAIPTTTTTGNSTPKKKKTVPIPKVTLIQGDEVLVTSLEEAQKLSKRRHLKLVKIVDVDTKTERPVYKLMTAQEYNAEDLKQREVKKKEKQNKTIKGEKILMIGQNISEHDLQTQINKITKWITRSYEVKVVINGDSSVSKTESVYNTIEKAIGELGRIVQKRQKEFDIKFQVLPPRKQQSETASKSPSISVKHSSQSDGESDKPKTD